MNPDDSEIRAIAAGGGLIGVIFMNYWLRGVHKGRGISHVLDTIAHLIDVGGERCVAIGSDFDGYTDPPDDLREPSDVPALTAALLDRFPVSTVDRLLGANFLQLLAGAWSRT
jgi:membrane dipeptidase